MTHDNSDNSGQSGGINTGGGSITAGGGVTGRDKITYNQISRAELDQAFQPLTQAVGQHPEAQKQLEALKIEAAKGKKADDGVMAKLLNGIIKLVPGAVSAVVSAFGTPLLGGIAGPVTKYALEKIKGG
jgi:hypothetical protein